MTMTANVRPITQTPDTAARRRRARRFWGAMGAMKRFEDRRLEPAHARNEMTATDHNFKRAA
jgi:hypothetical protein